MDITKFFDGKAFVISLAIGIFFVYISAPENQVIYIYPNPENTNKYLYKDKTDTCYKFSPKQVECPEKKSLIMKYPIQAKISNKNDQ